MMTRLSSAKRPETRAPSLPKKDASPKTHGRATRRAAADGEEPIIVKPPRLGVKIAGMSCIDV